MPPHIAEAWDSTDDWTGITSAAERRKRQNRLHQRAHRKKRLLLHKNQQAHSALVPERCKRCGVAVTRDQGHLSHVETNPVFLIRCPRDLARAVTFAEGALLRHNLHRPRPDDLPMVSRLTALQALARNAQLLNILAQDLFNEDSVSRFSIILPSLPGRDQSTSRLPMVAPESLRPTALQQSVPHHPWLDLVPIPALRDNILLAISQGWINEDELCIDLFSAGTDTHCGMNGPGVSTTATLSPLVAWGEPWDEKAWELSPTFIAKWAPLMRGCAAALQVTNQWRRRRGLEQLLLDDAI